MSHKDNHENNHENNQDASAPRGLRAVFKRCATCAGAGGAGFALGHLGCIAGPVAFAALGAGGVVAGAGAAAAMITASLAFTATGLGTWYGLRGRNASAAERKTVLTGAGAGLVLMAAFHMASSHDHHHAVLEADDLCSAQNPVNVELLKPEL